MDPRNFAFADLCELTTAELCNIYHLAQLTYVADCVGANYSSAHDWLLLTLNCRRIVMHRYRDSEKGHADFYKRLVDEYLNFTNFWNNWTHRPFYFECNRLVKNAIDAGIHVPISMWPK